MCVKSNKDAGHSRMRRDGEEEGKEGLALRLDRAGPTSDGPLRHEPANHPGHGASGVFQLPGWGEVFACSSFRVIIALCDICMRELRRTTSGRLDSQGPTWMMTPRQDWSIRLARTLGVRSSQIARR